MNEQYVKASLKEAQVGLDALINNEAMIGRIAAAGHLIAQSQKAGGSVFSCGNGGSLCDAMHFAEEMTGRYRKNRQPFRAVPVGSRPSENRRMCFLLSQRPGKAPIFLRQFVKRKKRV